MSLTTEGLVYFAQLISSCGEFELAVLGPNAQERVQPINTVFAGNSIQFYAKVSNIEFTVDRFEIRLKGSSTPVAPNTFATPVVLAEFKIVEVSVSPRNEFEVTYTMPLGGKTFEGVANA